MSFFIPHVRCFGSNVCNAEYEFSKKCDTKEEALLALEIELNNILKKGYYMNPCDDFCTFDEYEEMLEQHNRDHDLVQQKMSNNAKQNISDQLAMNEKFYLEANYYRICGFIIEVDK